MSIRGKTAIMGFYELPTLKEYPERNTMSLLAETANGAIRDAGLRKEDIDGLISSEALNSLTLAEWLKIKPRYTASMTVHGSSGATSIATAAAAISAGLANYVLCIFGGSRPRSSSRLGAAKLPRGGGGPPTRISEWEAPFGPVIAANGGCGLIKQRYMYEYGATQEQFAKCAIDERFSALANPNALWKGQPVTIEDVLNSRYTNDPLHLLESVIP